MLQKDYSKSEDNLKITHDLLDKYRSDNAKIVGELTKEVIFQLNVKNLCHFKSTLKIPQWAKVHISHCLLKFKIHPFTAAATIEFSEMNRQILQFLDSSLGFITNLVVDWLMQML